MENGVLNANTAATLALLADTARAGRGGGWSGGEGYGGYGCGPFANPSSNAVRIDRNVEVCRDQGDFTRYAMNSQLASVSRQFDSAEMSRRFTKASDDRFQSELRMSDRLRDIDREIAMNARTAAQCCADLKLQVCEDKSQILARMEELSKNDILRDLSRAERELQALKTQVACGCTTGCSRTCPEA